MTRVSNSDQVLALVRNQLQRLAKREPTDKKQAAKKAKQTPLTQHQRLQALLAVKKLNQREFTKGLIRGLLSDEIGDEFGNSARFQEVIERTSNMMDEDPETRALIKSIREQL